ncbi:MAG TPA: 3D domain-containing protein, partial [Chthoniobacterales bacterium]
ANLLRLTSILGLAAVLSSCASTAAPIASTAARSRVHKVKTTAYCANDGGSGTRNAIGQRLSAGTVRSASSDWSRFPLGTRFRVVRTGQEYVIDDYGGALIGTNTIDLYKPSRSAMYSWGVRHEEIEILHWGSANDSLKVLRQRRGVGKVRRMIASLESKPQQQLLPTSELGRVR